MTDVLIVLGCLATGYVIGRIQGEVRHAAACKKMGLHLHRLAVLSDDGMRAFLVRLADSLIGEEK